MKILIVDDEPVGRNVLRQVVEHYGHEVVEAGEGQEGLEKASRHKPDAIICDALMPKMDGFQFLKAVRQDETLSSIPFVFYTEIYTDNKEYELALSLGADAVIVKPKAPSDFWKEFTSALDAHASKKKPAFQQPLTERDEIARDITERQKAVAEVQRLATAVERAVEDIIITDVKGIIEYVNPAF